MSESTEALEERVRAGDADALAEFIEAKQPQLLAFIRRSMSDALSRKVEPQDVLQETAVSAVNSLDDFDFSQREPFGWLCHLAERRIIDAHRRFFGAKKRDAGREVGLHTPSGDSDTGGMIDMLVASMTSPSQAFSRGQKEFVLLEALQTLPEESREALRLRYVENLSTKEIAAQIGKSDGAVRVMLSRSLSKLQEILSQDEHFQ